MAARSRGPSTSADEPLVPWSSSYSSMYVAVDPNDMRFSKSFASSLEEAEASSLDSESDDAAAQRSSTPVVAQCSRAPAAGWWCGGVWRSQLRQKERQCRRNVRRALEDPTSGPIAGFLNQFMLFLILSGTLCVVVETVPALEPEYSKLFQVAELLFTACFTTEILVRMWIAQDCSAYWSVSQNVVDVLATLPWYMEMLCLHFFPEGHHKHKHLSQVAGSLRVLRILRLLRMFRIAKVARHSHVVPVVIESLMASRAGLYMMISLVGMGTILSATLVYAIESDIPDTDFASIPAAMWWALTTITTVGYGDLVPRTAIGKMVGCVTMVGGTLVVSLSVAMITTSFTEQYRHRSELAKIKKAVKAKTLSRKNTMEDGAAMDDTKAHIELVERFAKLEDELREALNCLEGQMSNSFGALAGDGGSEGLSSNFRSLATRGSMGSVASNSASLPTFVPTEALLLENLRGQATTLFQVARGLTEQCVLLRAASWLEEPPRTTEPREPEAYFEREASANPQTIPEDHEAKAPKDVAEQGAKPFSWWPRVARAAQHQAEHSA